MSDWGSEPDDSGGDDWGDDGDAGGGSQQDDSGEGWGDDGDAGGDGDWDDDGNAWDDNANAGDAAADDFFDTSDQPDVQADNLCTDADTKFKEIPTCENLISKIAAELEHTQYDMNAKKEEGQDVSDMEATVQNLKDDLEKQQHKKMQLLEESLKASEESLKIEQEADTTSWESSFKLRNQQRMIQIFLQMSKFDQAYNLYSEVLKLNLSDKNLENYVESVVTQGIKTRLHKYGEEASPDNCPLGPQEVFKWYDLTNKALETSNNWSLWFKFSLQFVHMFHEAGYADPSLNPHPFPELKEEIPKVIAALYKQLEGNDKDKSKKLEIYAIDISLAYLGGDVTKMKELYKKVRPLFKYAAGVDLKVQARLRLLGGQMYLHEQSFINAAKEYVEAAKQYKAASQPLCALAPLFYALMCNMIASEMFPEQNVVRDGRVFFDTMSVSKETEAVRQLQDSLGQQDLALNSAQSMRVAFDKCDLTALQEQVDIFRQCINARNYTNSFSDKDKENFERLLPKVWDAVRRRMMQNVLRPYKRVKLEFIGQQLRMPKADAEHMLMQMILNKKLSGRIDSETESFTFTSATTSTNPASGLFDDLLAWSDTLQTLQTNLANKLDTTPDSFGFAASALEAQMVMGGGRSVGYGGGMRGLFSKFL